MIILLSFIFEKLIARNKHSKNQTLKIFTYVILKLQSQLEPSNILSETNDINKKMKLKVGYILAGILLTILIIWKLTSRPQSSKFREEKKHFDRGIEKTIKALQKEFNGLQFRIQENKSSLEFGTVLSDSKHQILKVLLSTSWRSGSTFLAELLNQYPGQRWKWDFWELKG